MEYASAVDQPLAAPTSVLTKQQAIGPLRVESRERSIVASRNLGMYT